MTITIPEFLTPLLDEYLALLEERLPGLVGGFYLQGGLARASTVPVSSGPSLLFAFYATSENRVMSFPE